MITRYGEMIDMISCLAVYRGAAKEKRKRSMTFDEMFSLR